MRAAPAKIRARARFAACVVLPVLACLSIAQGVRDAIRSSQDMQWSGARLLIHGHDPYAIWLSGNRAGEIILSQSPPYSHLLYFLMAPFGAMGWGTAKVLWSLVNVGLGLGVAVFLCRAARLDLSTTTILTSVFLISTPFRNSVGNGQQSLVALAALTAAVFATRTVGKVFGTSVAITKYSFAPPLILLHALRLRARVLVLTAIVSAAAFVGFWAIVGGSAWTVLLEPLRVSRRATGGGTADVMALVGHQAASHGAIAIAAGILTTLLLMFLARAWRHDWDPHADLALIAIVSLVSFKHLPYDFVGVLPLLVLSRRYSDTARWVVYGVVGWFFFGMRLLLSAGVAYDTRPLVLFNLLVMLLAFAIVIREQALRTQPIDGGRT